MGNFFTCALLVLTFLASAYGVASEADINRVAQSTYWLKLLHYETSFPYLHAESRLVGPAFFFAQNGQVDPKAELLATIDAFSKDLKVGPLKQHPQCAFPERFRFLTQELALTIPKVPCPDYENFMKRLNPQSAALVFSSAYAGSPGSMFGHTFLKIVSGRKPDLLDYGISFAANIPQNDNSLKYVLFGLFGGYEGQFSLLPYYAKVDEYINSESRDLWEYSLNLTPEQTNRMVSHLWELQTNSWFNYYFLNENCSYQILAALEIARPDWDLTQDWFFVIPAETVKRMFTVPGAVTGIKYRPSLRKQMDTSFAKLSDQDQSQFWALINQKESPKAITSSGILDSTALYLEYLRKKEGGQLNSSQAQLWTEVLSQRSRLPVSETPLTVEPPKDGHPELGHGPSRVGLSFGAMNLNGASGFEELSIKSAYHDLLNNDLGYLPDSEIDFPGLTLRYIQTKRELEIENLQLVRVVSLFPQSFLEKKISWKLDLEYLSPKDFGCIDCHVAHAEAGVGAAIDLGSKNLLAYGFATGKFEAGQALGSGVRGGIGPEAGLLLNPCQSYKLSLSGSMNTDLFQSTRQKFFYFTDLAQSLSVAQNWEARLEALHYFPGNSNYIMSTSYEEAKLTIFHYF